MNSVAYAIWLWLYSHESYSSKGVVDSSSKVKEAKYLSEESLHGGPGKLLHEAVKIKPVLLWSPRIFQMSEL